MKLKYTKKTLAEILNEHPDFKRILLKFYHGMGDAIMFYANCLPALERAFPDRDFYFETQLGQEEFFGDADRNEAHYDLSVFLNFPCAEWDEGPETKAEKCAREELGIEIGEDHPSRYRLPFFCLSPLVGFHFVSTSNDSICCPENFAYHLWEKTVARGLIPIDTHMQHHGATIERDIFCWEKHRAVVSIAPSCCTLFGLIGSLGGFAGVASGNFWLALCILEPRKILFIETEFPVWKLTHCPVFSVKASDPDESVIDAWLTEIKKGTRNVQ